ncbi:MAG: hypothetical protein AAF745_00685 [Planctomycetota bacterium]
MPYGWSRRLTFCFGLASWLAAGAVVPTSAEEWTSLDGSRTVQADMVGLWDGHVVLLMESGRRVSVPMQSLIAESRIQAEKVADRLRAERQRLSTELRNVAEAEAAPAPDPLPEPPSTLGRAEMPAGLSADEAIQRIQDQLFAGRFTIMWRALPPSMRQSMQQLHEMSLKQTEGGANRRVAELLNRVANLVVTRQNWIASYPPLKEADDQGQAVRLFREIVVPLARAIRDGLPPEALDPANSANQSMMSWLEAREDVMAPFLAQIIRRYADSPVEWEVTNETDGTATVSLMPPQTGPEDDNPASFSRRPPPRGRTITLLKVDGYWLPKPVAEGLVDMLESFKQKMAEGDSESQADSLLWQSAMLGSGPPKPGRGGFGGPGAGGDPQAALQQLPLVLNVLESALAQFETADNAAAFHQTIDGAAAMTKQFTGSDSFQGSN